MARTTLRTFSSNGVASAVATPDPFALTDYMEVSMDLSITPSEDAEMSLVPDGVPANALPVTQVVAGKANLLEIRIKRGGGRIYVVGDAYANGEWRQVFHTEAFAGNVNEIAVAISAGTMDIMGRVVGE